MKRAPLIQHVIRRDRRLQAATDRAIDAVLGMSPRRLKSEKPPWPARGEVEQEFREAQRRRA
jgi:hypothetical protein